MRALEKSVPRPRSFDRTRALRRAMELFTRQGYEATSVQALGAHLGLQPGSLYNTFKDKHSLFLEALDCYQELEGDAACRFFAGPDKGKAALLRFFELVIESDLDDADHKGCLMVNSAAELGARDPDVLARVQASRAQMVAILRAVVIEAQTLGEIAAGRSPDDLATMLVNSLFGLRITAKVLRDREALLQIAASTLDAL